MLNVILYREYTDWISAHQAHIILAVVHTKHPSLCLYNHISYPRKLLLTSTLLRGAEYYLGRSQLPRFCGRLGWVWVWYGTLTFMSLLFWGRTVSTKTATFPTINDPAGGPPQGVLVRNKLYFVRIM